MSDGAKLVLLLLLYGGETILAGLVLLALWLWSETGQPPDEARLKEGWRRIRRGRTP